MKYNVELLKADIMDELAKLKQLGEEYSHNAEKLNQTDISAYDRGAIGYYLHNFYVIPWPKKEIIFHAFSGSNKKRPKYNETQSLPTPGGGPPYIFW